MEQFNTEERLGSIERGHRVSTGGKLVKLIAYCVNPNHFHFILEGTREKGIEKFLHKLSMGYAKYFNAKYKRSGALFEGKFKAKHIDSNEYLLHLSAYINLNDKAHGRGHSVSEFSQSSWDEYASESCQNKLCDNQIVLNQFKNRDEYKKFAEGALTNIIERKMLLEELDI